MVTLTSTFSHLTEVVVAEVKVAPKTAKNDVEHWPLDLHKTVQTILKIYFSNLNVKNFDLSLHSYY